MYLTLEVVGAQSASLGADRRRVVGTNGLTIGRDDTSEWTIPEPYISRQHARVTFTNGRFFVEGLGRNPIALNNLNNALPSSRPFELKTGDHLLIDQYDILVTVHPGEAPGTRPMAVPDDPFGLMQEAAPAGPALPAARARSAIPEMWSDGSESHIETVQLDPLVALGVSVDGRASAPEPRVNLQSDSPLRDPYSPPPPRMPPAPEVAPARDRARIPDAWDQSAVDGAPAVAAPDRGRRSGVPVDWDHSAAPMPRAMPVRAASAPRPAPSAVIPPAAPLPHATVQSAVLPTTGALAPAGARATPPGQASGDMAAGLRELLLGAGLTELSPEAMRELGQVLRIVVQGVMQVLQARSEIKAQFRLPLTRVQARENNPLKFSPDVESVLNTLLVRRNAAYLATVPAFEEAFADIRNHQMALLEGIRVAFDSMVKRFDPAELQKQFDSSAKGNAGLFSRNGLGAKSRYWDLYREFFERLGTDADDTFRRLFGDVFAQAYEQQLNRMKRPAGGRNVEGQGE